MDIWLENLNVAYSSFQYSSIQSLNDIAKDKYFWDQKKVCIVSRKVVNEKTMVYHGLQKLVIVKVIILLLRAR